MASRYELLEFGRLTPANRKDDALKRISGFGTEIVDVIKDLHPDRVVIEVTSGKVGGRRHMGNGAGLATYGMAVGFIWSACEQIVGRERVDTVYENDWSNGVPKDRRLRHVASQFPAYAQYSDPGGDAGDAIGLGQWWFFAKGVVAA
jgi:hypothetical protein